MTASRRLLSEADQADWAAYARHIRPLAGREHPVMPPGRAEVGQEPAPVAGQSRKQQPARILPSPLALGVQPGGLDLHGYTIQRAYHALAGFLRLAHADHVRCVEIVTGRGSSETGSTIRRELPLWLNLPEIRPLVLGAVHPHPANPGAVRLLLRRQR
jgi:Smr domain-containing protein